MSSDIGIGSTVFIFDENNRDYRVKDGRTYGAPIYRNHWVPRKIIGETARSWVLQGDIKLVKKRPAGEWVTGPRQPGYGGYRTIASEAEIDQQCWMQDHCYGIMRLVERCRYETLKQIAALVGYEETEKGGAK